ncbi:hypothetical protein AIGOOFII_2890 [Methylobacterium marchantiae]|nr:hypothetical protein AIGOOFII_2890 [Methylobacterium marchantiae]
MAGASAGAITGALGIVALARGLRPVTLSDEETAVLQGTANTPFQSIRCVLPTLYETWVTRPCMVAAAGSKRKDLLGKDDVAPCGPDGKVLTPTKGAKPLLLRSVLNATLLDEIERAGLLHPESGPAAQPGPFPYLADTLNLIVTVTNLRGIPFDVAFGQGSYGMQTHGDRLHFAIGGVGTAVWPKTDGLWLAADKSLRLDAATLPGPGQGDISEEWRSYGNAAIASAAFPGGLAPRTVSTPFEQYEKRQYPYRLTNTGINAAFPSSVDLTGKYNFVAVDGGVVNNSPFDFVEHALWNPGETCKTGEDADRAVIMVAPFPEPPAFPPEGYPALEIVSIFRALFPALIDQARFRPSELGPAVNPNDRSRFMISPIRSLQNGPIERYPIACGLLGGFGGFLDEAFRAHDYQLGRRNCQRFLASVFGLPASSSVLMGSDGAVCQALSSRSDPYGKGAEEAMILPLCGNAAVEVGLPPWPKMSGSAFRTLSKRIAGRLDAIHRPFIAAQVQKSEIRWAASGLYRISRRRLLNFIELTILSDLVRRNQIVGWDLPVDLIAPVLAKQPGRTVDDVRLILACLVSPMYAGATKDEIVAMTSLEPCFVRQVLKTLTAVDEALPFRVIRRNADVYSLQMHAPLGFRSWPLIGGIIRYLWPQPYRYA